MNAGPSTLHLAVIVDSSELWPHPWRFYAPADVELRRGKIEVGSMALAGAETAAVVRRLTIGELLARIGKRRAAFEAELQRVRHVGWFTVVVEGSFDELVDQAARVRPRQRRGHSGGVDAPVLPVPVLRHARTRRGVRIPVSAAALFRGRGVHDRR